MRSTENITYYPTGRPGDPPSVTYSRRLRLATFTGPGGFTQQVMAENYAKGIATALGVPFSIEQEPGGEAA